MLECCFWWNRSWLMKMKSSRLQDTGQRLEKTEWAIKNGQSKESGNTGYTRHRTKVRETRRGNQERTIQRNWPFGFLLPLSCVLCTQCCQFLWIVHSWLPFLFSLTFLTGQRLEKTKGAIKNGQFRDTGNIGYTRHMTKVRENQRSNQECTVQRHWQHWVHKTQDEDKQN
jgi:hypothetical protein